VKAAKSSANLPDVNFLIALVWKNHIHHTYARRWFLEHSRETFATCPVTESGFIRLSMNPSVVGEAVHFTAAAAAMETFNRLPNHCFWPLKEGVVSTIGKMSITGYRQLTDAYLLGIAASMGGRLITFDKKMEGVIEGLPEYGKHLLVVGSS
jgi:uncharacterized protein